MEITGRITVDATVHKVNNDKQVVNFSIAINDSYKPKNSTGIKEIVTYIDCSYWLNSKSAEWLKKGTLVQLFGRIGLSVYSNSDGKALGRLTFHTNSLKILVFANMFHAFPKSVDGFATKFGQFSTNLGIDGKSYQWLEMSGSYGGKTGTFEYIKDSNGLINHRFFNVPKIP